MKTVRFALVFKQGTEELARVEGRPRPTDVLTVEDVTEKVVELENLVERLTGLRCHVMAVEDLESAGDSPMARLAISARCGPRGHMTLARALAIADSSLPPYSPAREAMVTLAKAVRGLESSSK